MSKQAVIFDLDGVIVSTDEYHYQAWKKMSEAEGITFNRETNERLRGVSRMESLSIILEQSTHEYTAEEQVALAEMKNAYYKELLANLSPEDILPGVRSVLDGLRERGPAPSPQPRDVSWRASRRRCSAGRYRARCRR